MGPLSSSQGTQGSAQAILQAAARLARGRPLSWPAEKGEDSSTHTYWFRPVRPQCVQGRQE